MALGKKAKEMERSVLQEAFRVLKSNIVFSDKENRIKTITVTSCSPGEGRTTVALNLATSFARSNHKTLLIDAEFRKIKIRSIHEGEPKLELSKLDFRSTHPGKYIKDTSIDNLSYVSIESCLSNPETLFDSSQTRSFINYLGKDFDTVIIDVPPLDGVIDSAIVAGNTDAAILVVQSKRHDYRTVLQAKEQLEKASARLLGVVLCKVDNRVFKSYFTYQKNCRKVKPKQSLKAEKLGVSSEKYKRTYALRGWDNA